MTTMYSHLQSLWIHHFSALQAGREESPEAAALLSLVSVSLAFVYSLGTSQRLCRPENSSLFSSCPPCPPTFVNEGFSLHLP